MIDFIKTTIKSLYHRYPIESTIIGFITKDGIVTTATIDETVERGTVAIVEIIIVIIAVIIAIIIAVITDVTIDRRTISISPETVINIKIAINTTIIRIKFTS